MKLLLLNHNLREVGGYFRALHFGRQLVRFGHDVTLVTASPGHWYRPAADRIDGVEVVESPSWNPCMGRDDGFGPLDIAYRMKVVLGRRWDGVFAFAHPPNVMIPAFVWRALGGRRVAVDWCDLYGGDHGIVSIRKASRAAALQSGTVRIPAWHRAVQNMAWGMEPWMESTNARRAPKLTVISRFLYDRALSLGVAKERLMHLPSGAPGDRIRPQEKGSARKKLGLVVPEGEALIVLVTSAYHHEEDYILESLAKARQQGARFRFLVVGPKFPDGRIAKHGLEGVVDERGRQPFDTLQDWLGAADLLLLPYPDSPFNRSRWPNKVGDYLAAGRPSITNKTGDFVPIFAEHSIGLATDSTTDAFGRGIADAVAAREHWDRWGMNARAVAEGPLSWERLAERFAKFWLG